MLKYGHLKCVELEDNDFAWFFTTYKNEELQEEKLQDIELVKVLNVLGKEGWELVSIDATLGFVLKRKL